MPTLTSKWRYLFMLLGVQLIVMALLSREAYQKRVTYFFRIFRKLDVLSGSAGPGSGHGSNHTGGPIHVSFPSGLTLAQVERKNPLVVRGGRYRPPDCEARHRTAIIIPHRNREQHLKFFLYYIHPFLQRQQLSYGIYCQCNLMSLYLDLKLN
ncbi:hypothetical protein HF521_011069 [Silurus meridionalis]|uniref:Galactosyltransferase N-terminal domain-containing protein n=1 Tax=Silurus meridionalis TaxID=175797 RepID=A0A8T0AI13_SILME|nr:hypothetical protein HF521_011069 [Silurus meridionalis]